jgi:acetylornithine/succinyldiaminopimelate/putrescine aminotransferase
MFHSSVKGCPGPVLVREARPRRARRGLGAARADSRSLRSRTGLTKVYFGNSGAEGIESALKFAIAATGKSAFVSFSNGYHGMTLGALSLTDAPHLTRRFSGAGVSTHMAVLGDLDRVEMYLRKHEVAAAVVEIVQGMAGATSWPADRLIALFAVCKKYDALLVVDEVLTGLGRTGEWFAFTMLTSVPTSSLFPRRSRAATNVTASCGVPPRFERSSSGRAFFAM